MNVPTLTDAPLIQIFTILIEDLYAPVFSIVDENSVRGWIDRNAVHVIPVVGAGFVAAVPSFAPGSHIVAVRIEFYGSGTVVAVGNHEARVREPSHKRRAVKVRLIRTELPVCPDRLHQCGSVIRELVDDMLVVVNDPNMLFGREELINDIQDLLSRPKSSTIIILEGNRRIASAKKILKDKKTRVKMEEEEL